MSGRPFHTMASGALCDDPLQSLQLDLARALGRARRSPEAVALYRALQPPAMEGDPLAWLGYAAALVSVGDAHGAESALDAALHRPNLSPEACPCAHTSVSWQLRLHAEDWQCSGMHGLSRITCRASSRNVLRYSAFFRAYMATHSVRTTVLQAAVEAVVALCRLRLAHSDADAMLRALQEHLPTLAASAPTPAAMGFRVLGMERLWATLQAGVAVAGTLISDADLRTMHLGWQVQP